MLSKFQFLFCFFIIIISKENHYFKINLNNLKTRKPTVIIVKEKSLKKNVKINKLKKTGESRLNYLSWPFIIELERTYIMASFCPVGQSIL